MIIYFKSQLIKAFGFISVLLGHKEAQVEVSWTFFISPIFDNAQLLPQVVVSIPELGFKSRLFWSQMAAMSQVSLYHKATKELHLFFVDFWGHKYQQTWQSFQKFCKHDIVKLRRPRNGSFAPLWSQSQYIDWTVRP